MNDLPFQNLNEWLSEEKDEKRNGAVQQQN